MDIVPVSHPGQIAPAAVPAQAPNWLAENRELIRNVKEVDAAALFGEGSELSFARDPETKRPVVRVINRQTGEVMWQAPPEYLLQVARTLREHAPG